MKGKWLIGFMRQPASWLTGLMLAAPSPAVAQGQAEPLGLWLNPHNSVIVRTSECAGKLCGFIVWANAEAQSDARESGVTKLVGVELLEDYHPDGKNSWAGTVYVPDMGKHFSSEIDQLSPNQLKVKGCILGGLICKSQIWTRVERVPAE